MNFADLVAASKSKPPWISDEFDSHLQYILYEAEKAAREGKMDTAFINLAHALVIAVEKREPMSVDEVRSWFRKLTSAAEVW